MFYALASRLLFSLKYVLNSYWGHLTLHIYTCIEYFSEPSTSRLL